MDNKTITRKKYHEIVAAVDGEGGPIFVEHRKVDVVLEMLGYTVGRPLIMPDVSGGDWKVEYEDDMWDIWAIFKTGPKRRIACQLRMFANAKVMAGSKKLVELLVKDLRSMGTAYANGGETKAVVKQLADMGVDVSEFTEGDQ